MSDVLTNSFLVNGKLRSFDIASRTVSSTFVQIDRARACLKVVGHERISPRVCLCIGPRALLGWSFTLALN